MGIYDEVDRALYPWAKKHGLHIFTEDRECEVRTTFIVDDTGNVYDLSLEPEPESEKIRIHFGYRAKVRKDRKSKTCDNSLGSLSDDLEQIYAQIQSWITESSNTRTPVL